nr:RNA-directed DNA polymerase, eukaryota [Tanacetum cinerariifolium]
MESLHLSFSRAVDEGLFKGIQLPGSISISHIFYADDAMFIGEWSDGNLKGIINILKNFFLASGLQINILKSQLLGVGVPHYVVDQAASSIGCSIMNNQFCYLGVMVGECSSRLKAWDDIILKLRSRLSKWKVKTLSIRGRLTLLKAVLGASPLYTMSIFKVPRGVLKVIRALYGSSVGSHPTHLSSNWCSIVRELHKLKGKGFDFWSHCKKHIRNGNDTRFWSDCWIGDMPLYAKFPCLFALELDKEASMSLSNSCDRWFYDLASDGDFWVKEVRNFIDDLFLPSQDVPTRWVKSIPIKVNVFAWSGRPGSYRSGSHPRLNLCWRVFSLLLGGLFGGVIVVVVGCFLGWIG